jgi:hypothetical protein
MATTQIRGNTQIIAGTIVDAQISATAAIQLTKLQKVPITPDGATAFTANQSMGGFVLTNAGTPVASTDVPNKAYVDNVAQGLATKQSVRALASANITLSGTQTIDGVALSVGDTVLCIGQTTGSQNGSYVVAAGAWTRTLDFDDVNDAVRSPYWFVGEGTVNAGSGWVMTTWPYTIGTTALSFTQFSGAGEIIAGNGLQKSGNTLSINTAVTVDLSTAQTLTNKSIDASEINSGTLTAARMPALTGDVTTTAGSVATTIANGAVTLAKMANLAANSVIGNATGSAAVPTAVGMVSAATANTVMYRDANANVQANSFIENVATTATAAGTTTLTVGSAAIQQFTGTTTQTVVMPNATTMANGQQFYITNRSTGLVTVNANGGGLLQSMAASSYAIFTLINNGTAAGTWDVAYAAPTTGTVTSVSVVTANGFAGTVATATTTPAITITTTVTGVLKGNGTAISAAVAGTDYMAPADFVVRETPTGLVNSSNTTYTLANTPLVGTEQVFLNGLLQEPGAGNDYTISGATITYLTAPTTGDRLRVSYYK